MSDGSVSLSEESPVKSWRRHTLQISTGGDKVTWLALINI